MSGPLTRQELAALRREYLREFKETYKEARREFTIREPFVEARLLGMTGIILGELERFGLIERKGTAYAPAGTKAAQPPANSKARFYAKRRK